MNHRQKRSHCKSLKRECSPKWLQESFRSRHFMAFALLLTYLCNVSLNQSVVEWREGIKLYVNGRWHEKGAEFP